MSFRGLAVDVALDRQDSHCAKCGKEFKAISQGYDWFPHPLIPFSMGGKRNAKNCVIFCKKCLFTIGHAGISDDYECAINPSDLPHFQDNPDFHY
jgi:hypothetical protein